MSKFWTWLVVSSENPNKIALTVKGGVSAIFGVLLIVSPVFGWNLGSGDVEKITSDIVQIVILVFTALSALVSAFGFGRKILNTL